jgi:hypothetical protein
MVGIDPANKGRPKADGLSGRLGLHAPREGQRGHLATNLDDF